MKRQHLFLIVALAVFLAFGAGTVAVAADNGSAKSNAAVMKCGKDCKTCKDNATCKKDCKVNGQCTKECKDKGKCAQTCKDKGKCTQECKDKAKCSDSCKAACGKK